MRAWFPLSAALLVLGLIFAAVPIGVFPATAQQAAAPVETLRPLVDALTEGKFAETEAAIVVLAETGDPRVVPALQALKAGELYARKSDRRVVIAGKSDSGYALTDPLTGEAVGEVGSSRELDKIRVNNNLRRVIDNAVGGLTLRSPDAAVRRSAAAKIFESQDTSAIPLLDKAIEAEQDARVRRELTQARAAAIMASDASDDDKRAAIEVLIDRGDQGTRSLLLAAMNGASDALKPDIERAVGVVEDNLASWAALQNVWYGLSLGSVLLLAAIGLAITFGVMGVINMAHGEMVMLGAYTTFVVQEVIRTNAPGLFDYSLAIAVPLAFLVAGAVGIAIERSVIRWLYGRALETLLATWGISLILQQAVRSLFGPTNREVGAPSFMSGAFEIGQLTITYNRLWIIIFSFMVLGALALVLRKTRFGLQMRAVTQNRGMASSMGIRTSQIDALTFGLGSGIAGIAGVALSQIDNVSPNLGQSYIVDSFMVVVFGGVGNLWGTLVGAMSLGVANKFLEPYAGAVLGKILVLVFIILFIQKRPRGLFALKGRAVDA
jgi:urea transport system permease protein